MLHRAVFDKWPFVRKDEKEYFTHSCVQNVALEALKKLATLVLIWKATWQLGRNKKRDFQTIFFSFIICTFVYFCIVWVCMCVGMRVGTNVYGKVRTHM